MAKPGIPEDIARDYAVLRRRVVSAMCERENQQDCGYPSCLDDPHKPCQRFDHRRLEQHPDAAIIAVTVEWAEHIESLAGTASGMITGKVAKIMLQAVAIAMRASAEAANEIGGADGEVEAPR